MLKLIKNKNKIKNNIFLKSCLGNLKIYFVDDILKIPDNVQIKIKNQKIFFKGILGKLSLIFTEKINLFYQKNNLFLIINIQKNKKSILNLYNKLIKIKIKGISQGFKLRLILQGIGFKAFIEKKYLILKLGYSHNILIPIPINIQIINQSNILIFNSIDSFFLSQYVHYIKNFKKPEPYKGKGLLLKNEKIFKKEGKKSKK